jgi:hypothetical protein
LPNSTAVSLGTSRGPHHGRINPEKVPESKYKYEHFLGASGVIGMIIFGGRKGGTFASIYNPPKLTERCAEFAS